MKLPTFFVTALSTMMIGLLTGCFSMHVQTTEPGHYVLRRDVISLRHYIQAGGNPNAPGIVGQRTPIIWGAATSGAYEMVQYLIDVGADANWKNEKGQTVYDLMVSQKWRSREPQSNDQKTLAILRRYRRSE